MKHIKILGITGAVGAGKSTVLNYFENKYHARVIQLDRAAHYLMEPEKECWKGIVEVFGKEILKNDGTIDRSILGNFVFGDEQKVEKLNKIVHPQVKKYIKQEIQKEEKLQRVPFIVLEAALLLEDHYDEICDEIWYVYVNEEARKERLRKSRGYTDEKTEAILKNQKSDREFRDACQFVIDNSSDFMENTYEQIDEGLKRHGIL